MFCKKCGKIIDNDSEFCKFCGAVVGEAHGSAKQLTCSCCKKPIKSEWEKCPSCHTANPHYKPDVHVKEAAAPKTETEKKPVEPVKKKKHTFLKVIAVILVFIVLTYILWELRNAERRSMQEEIWKDENGHWVWETANHLYIEHEYKDLFTQEQPDSAFFKVRKV
ncbi:MAG: zinc ribbon domain-containing protein [Oscillospiraceae bacterium]|nr:zinc ribbon domain-containing protein [Oscillospiraceae bacterium]